MAPFKNTRGIDYFNAMQKLNGLLNHCTRITQIQQVFLNQLTPLFNKAIPFYNTSRLAILALIGSGPGGPRIPGRFNMSAIDAGKAVRTPLPPSPDRVHLRSNLGQGRGSGGLGVRVGSTQVRTRCGPRTLTASN